MSDTPLRFPRVLVKLSGEALLGRTDYGIDASVLEYLGVEIEKLRDAGAQIGVVIGGGNIFRGEGLASRGMERVTGDHIGMLATVINALALQDALERRGLFARVMSAIRINEVCEDFLRRRAIRHLEKGRVVIFAAGTGNPFFTTDSAASLRAVEIDADLMIKATKVDGVFSSDPEKNPAAARYERLDYDDVITNKLGVMDATAVVMCRDHQLPVRVLSMTNAGSLLRAVQGEDEGTLVASADFC
ncbi:MAG: UMP kinase [Pseudomonadota bacterium]